MPKSPPMFRAKERKRQVEVDRGTKQQRGYGGEWSRISRMYRSDHPVCEICKDEVAVDVDHIQPFSGRNDSLRTDWQNLQSVCRSCHRAKTERQNGR